MSAGIDIRALELNDLEIAASVHCAAFPNSALTMLGREGVRRYYEWQMVGPHDAAAFGAFRGSEMLGFCFCGVFRGAMSGFLRRNRFYIIARVLTHPWLLLNPVFRARVAGAAALLRRMEMGNALALTTGAAGSFGILSIAVDPRVQGGGVGKSLMQESENVARSSGISQMGLEVAPSNVRAVRFYESLGWQRVCQNGAWHGEMQKVLGDRTLSGRS